MQFVIKSEEIDHKKSIEFQNKQDIIDHRKKLLDFEMRKTLQQKAVVHSQKEEHILEQQSKFEAYKEEFDIGVKERIDKINERGILRKETTYKEMISKFDTLTIIREDHMEKYQTNLQAIEYKREKRLDSILQRMKRIEETK